LYASHEYIGEAEHRRVYRFRNVFFNRATRRFPCHAGSVMAVDEPKKARPLRLGAGALFVAYLALGPLVYPQRAEAELPMASWAVPKTEAQSREALHVLGAKADDPHARAKKTAGAERFLPDLRTQDFTEIYTVGSREKGDLRLKFDTTVYNAGRGPLETRGARNPKTGRLEVYQYVYSGERATKGRPVGTFNYSHRHGHLHFDGFARYELWSLDANGEWLARVAQNAKVGFCLMDIKQVSSDLTYQGSGLTEKPEDPVYAGCREDIQGISVGWGDEYLALLYEQDLDLTGVPSGDYALVVTTNPQRQIEELDYGNNAAVALVRLEGETAVWSSGIVRNGS